MRLLMLWLITILCIGCGGGSNSDTINSVDAGQLPIGISQSDGASALLGIYSGYLILMAIKIPRPWWV